jgi:hypothetical protein
MKTVENRIAHLLKLHWHLRNNDNDLIFVYWQEYDNYKKARTPKALTPATSIIRARQKLQHKGYYMPTEQKVIECRRLKQTEMREYALESEDKDANED